MADVITRFKVENTQYNKKIGQSKTMLDQLGMSGKGTSQILGQLEKTIGINIASFGKLTAAAGAVGTAMKVMKDAFFTSEQNIDSWGRTTEGAKAAYSTFVSAINSGDWSNFFNRLNDAIGGARELYDMFDRLGSMKTNNSVLIATLENKLAELRLMKQAGKDVEAQIKAINSQLSGLRGQEVAQGKAANRQGFINTLTNKGVSQADAEVFWNEFLKHGQKAFDFYGKQAAALGKNNVYVSSQGSSITGATGVGGMMWNGTASEQAKYKAYSAFVNAESELKPFIEGFANTIREETTNMQNEFKYNRWGSTGSGSGSGGGRGGKVDDPLAKLKFNANAVDEYEKKLKELRKTFIEVVGEMSSPKLGITRDAILGPSEEGAIDVSGFDPNALKKRMEEQIAQADALANAYTGAASAAASIGQALMAIEDPTAKVAGLIAQAIATIATTFAASLKGTFSPWDWIAGAAAGTATMVSTIAAIKSATAGHYANGGIVPGNSRSGDNLIASVNSGELILNHAQQTNLAAQLQANARRDSNDSLGVRVQGDTLYTCLDNYMKRTGKRFSA